MTALLVKSVTGRTAASQLYAPGLDLREYMLSLRTLAFPMYGGTTARPCRVGQTSNLRPHGQACGTTALRLFPFHHARPLLVLSFGNHTMPEPF